jgi:hypothetical protein
MSKRLQVVLDDAEYEAVERAARHEGVSVSAWVRQSLRASRRATDSGDVEEKLGRVRAAARLDFPTADIDRMLAEIERGYRST